MAEEKTDHTLETPPSTEDIIDPRDNDVLCGRGGAALRHPGNQTYRRLVNLNKGLYITCLKTEKLKISRSIVAAIREQKGRFLEKDAKKAIWYDIGDKKAIEKTSQALREGQPKLRKKIVEMGGGVAGTAAFMESQYGHTGLYNPEQVGLTSATLDGGGDSMMQQPQQRRQQEMQAMQPPQPMAPTHPGEMSNPDRLMQRLSLSDVSGVSGGNASIQSIHSSMQSIHSGHSMHSVESVHHRNGLQRTLQRMRPNSGSGRNPHDLGYIDSQLSLMSDFSAGYGGPSMGPSMGSMGSGGRQPSMNSMGSGRQPSIGSMGSGRQAIFEAPISLPNETLREYSLDASFRRTLAGLSALPQSSAHFSSGPGMDNSSFASSMDASGHTPLPFSTSSGTNGFVMNSGLSIGSSSTSSNTRDKVGIMMDRRGVFAKMKYNRPPSDRRQKAYPNTSSHLLLGGTSQHSYSDGLSDFNSMVESSASLYSTLSNMTGVESSHNLKLESNHNLKVESNHNNTNNGNGGGNYFSSMHETYVPPKPIIETAKVIDHSRSFREYSDVLNQGSRHSIMSGLSRISDTSIDHSIFSDLSRKIGNVSTRSLAMSEISTIDMLERDNEDSGSTCNSARNFGSALHLGIRLDEAKSDPPLEFHL